MAERTDRGVSPVIGTVVLIALVTILAATTAVFVLGIDTLTEPDLRQSLDSEDTPTADLSIDAVRGLITITHDGGDALPAPKVTIVTPDETIRWGDSGEVTEGDSRTVSGSEVRVRFSGETVAEWSG